MKETQFALRHSASGAEFELDKPSLSVGRAEDNDIVVAEGLPSRKHAVISCSAEGVTLEDLGSSNGTFVNGERLEAARSVPLKAGDVIRFDIAEYGVIDKGREEAADDKTMVRSAVSEADLEAAAAAVVASRSPEPSPVAAEQPSQPAPVAEKEQADEVVRPGAWADPDAATAVEGRTLLLDRDKLKSLLEEGAAGLENLDREFDYPALIITSGALTGSVFPLESSGQGESAWLIGSEPGCDIVLAEGNVSARHARLTQNSGRWQLTDQMTVNGTFVNGKKCTISYLDSGDRLTFGSVTAVFKLPGKQRKKAARSGAEKPKQETARKGVSSGLIIGVSFVATLAVAAAVYFLFLR